MERRDGPSDLLHVVNWAGRLSRQPRQDDDSDGGGGGKQAGCDVQFAGVSVSRLSQFSSGVKVSKRPSRLLWLANPSLPVVAR